MSDVFTIAGGTVDPNATELLPVSFRERFGSIPSLTLQRRGVALPTLPDPWDGQTVTWTHDGTLRFSGDVVSVSPSFDNRIGWILTYQCLGQRNRLDWFPHTDSTTGTYSSSFNLTLEDPLYNPVRAGRTVGQILTSILTMSTNATNLNGYGIGGYTGLPSTPALPAVTTTDLAALTLIPPAPVVFSGERFGQAMDGFLEQWAPNVLCWIDPQTGYFRFLDTRTFPAETLTMGQDPIEPTPLGRDVSNCFQRVVVRGQPIAVMALMKQSMGQITQNFAHDGLTNAQAIAAWSPSQFQGTQSSQDQGTCSCPSTTTVLVKSSSASEAWTAGFWDQSHNQGTIYLSSNTLSDYTQFWHARIVNCPALSAGGTCLLTIDNPLPSTNYDHYTINGLATGGSIVWRKYQLANANLWPRVTSQTTYPAPVVNPGGGGTTLTSSPMGIVLWSLNGTAPYLAFPVPFSTTSTTIDGNILFTAPTYIVANDAPPADIWIYLPVYTNPNTAIEPPNDGLGNATYTGTSNTVEGLTKTLYIDLTQWRDPGQLSQVQAYASDVLDSVKNAVIEGSVVYYGFFTDALTPGKSLNVKGNDGTGQYATMGWDTVTDLAIREVSIEWPQGEGMAYKTTMHASNRRMHFDVSAFLHPERRWQPIGGEGFDQFNNFAMAAHLAAGSAMGNFLSGGVNLASMGPGDMSGLGGDMSHFAPGDLASMGPGDLRVGNPTMDNIPTSMADLGIPMTPGDLGIPTGEGVFDQPGGGIRDRATQPGRGPTVREDLLPREEQEKIAQQGRAAQDRRNQDWDERDWGKVEQRHPADRMAESNQAAYARAEQNAAGRGEVDHRNANRQQQAATERAQIDQRNKARRQERDQADIKEENRNRAPSADPDRDNA